MLRIFTILRNAFERPPEREGRELRFAQKSGDERDKMAMGEEGGEKPATDREEEETLPPMRERTHEEIRDTIGSGEESREELPESGDGDERRTEGELHTGEEAGEEAREQAEKMRLRAEQLVEKANQALAKIKKIRVILMDEDFMEKIREAARRDTRVRDLLTSLEGDQDTCTAVENDVLDLKKAAEQCVLWQDPIEQTSQPQQFLEAMATARAKRTDLDPEEEERKAATIAGYRGRTDVSDIEASWDTTSIEEKAPFIEEFKNLADFDDMLGKMDDMLTSYNAALGEYLALIEKLRADLEKGNVPEPPQMEWGGNFTLKLIHFVYLAMAVKKIYDTWKKQWEYDFERAVGECAAAISPWVASNEVTQRLLEEEETNIRKIKDEKKKEYEKYSYEALYAAIITPHHDPAVKMAQLEVAAERGWLYGIEDESSSLTVLGLPISNFVPRSWKKKPSIIAEYFRQLRIKNGRGADERQKEGELESGLLIKRAGTPQVFQEIRKLILVEKDYWKAIGMIKHAFQSKVDIGEVGGGILATVMNCIQQDATFAKLIERYPNLVVYAGNAAAGFPSPVLYHLKIANIGIQQYASYIARGMASPERALEGDSAIVIKTWHRIQKEIETHGGLDLDDQNSTGYSANELNKMKMTEAQYRSNGFYPVALARAIGRVMECQEIRTKDGHIISIWSDEYKDYRDSLEKGDPDMKWDLNVSGATPEHFGRRNAFRLQSAAIMNELFTFDNTGFIRQGLRAANVAQDIVRQYEDLRKLATQDPAYTTHLRTFVTEMHKRFCKPDGPAYKMLTHPNFRDITQVDFVGLVKARIIEETDLSTWKDMGGKGAETLLEQIRSGHLVPDPIP